MSNNSASPSHPGKLVVSTQVKTVYSVAMFLGVIGFSMTLMTNQVRAWEAFLVGFFYLATLGVGGLFFTSLQYMVRAGWSGNVRRICEAFTSVLPYVFVLALVLYFGAGSTLYKWLDLDIVASDHLIAHKSSYLNSTFFLIRIVLFIGGWMLFSKLIVGQSLKQDETGDDSINEKLVRISIGCVVFFALSYSLFSVDTLMSLEPHWFSTIFGVYCFAGLFQVTMASMILVILFLKKQGLLGDAVNANHLHDLGKFLFGFTIFWAYIAFSQYMLIWYANLPEETFFFVPRTQHEAWIPVSIGLLVFKFVVPFFALLPKWAKRNPVHLAAVSILILIMQYVDYYWLIYPTFHPNEALFGLQEISIFMGFFGIFLFAVTRFLSRHPVIAYKDGRGHESQSHEVIY